ncbi:hypothetical protein C8Q80DRAFT_347848 [Daedaleopsis nitida]|nr:hypothetical protein C8Q80DRAFT_347848 [Daedaleopsis nitida]
MLMSSSMSIRPMLPQLRSRRRRPGYPITTQDMPPSTMIIRAMCGMRNVYEAICDLASQVQFEHAPQSSPYIDYYASVEADLIPPQVGWTIQADFRKSSIAPVFVQQSNGPGTSIAERTWGDCPSRTCFHPHPTALQTFALSPPARAEVFMPIAGFASHMSPSALVDAYQAVQHVPLLNVSFSHYPISHITPPTNVLLDHGAWSPEDPSSIPPICILLSPHRPPPTPSMSQPRSLLPRATASIPPSFPRALQPDRLRPNNRARPRAVSSARSAGLCRRRPARWT